MKTIKLITIGLLLLLQNRVISQETGSIKGVIMDKETGETIIGATATVYYAGNPLGSVSDNNGKFHINPLTSGTYTLEISYMGKETDKREIIVKSSQVAFRDTVFLSENATVLGSVVIKGDNLTLNPYEPSKPNMTGEQLKNMPDLRNTTNLISIIADGSITTSEDGKQVYFRGSRTNGIITYLDGMKVTGEIPTFPAAALKSVAVYTGGVPAKYGDTTGGVVVIETKSYFDWFNKKMARDKAAKGTTYSEK